MSHKATLSAVLSLAFFGVLAGNGEAAVISFSFSNVNGPVSGTVTGLITLPDGDGIFAATSLTVTSGPAALGYTYPFDTMSLMPTLVTNSFKVVGGEIDADFSNFGAQSGGSAFALNYPSIGSLLTTTFAFTTSDGVLDSANSTLVYGAAPGSVPEPGSCLGLLGLFSGGIVMRQRRRAQRV